MPSFDNKAFIENGTFFICSFYYNLEWLRLKCLNNISISTIKHENVTSQWNRFLWLLYHQNKRYKKGGQNIIFSFLFSFEKTNNNCLCFIVFLRHFKGILNVMFVLPPSFPSKVLSLNKQRWKRQIRFEFLYMPFRRRIVQCRELISFNLDFFWAKRNIRGHNKILEYKML